MNWRDRDDDETDLDDRDLPDESDADDNDEPDVVPCPYCRRAVSEDAEVCPHCGSFMSIEDAPSRRPPWLVAGALAALAGVTGIWALGC